MFFLIKSIQLQFLLLNSAKSVQVGKKKKKKDKALAKILNKLTLYLFSPLFGEFQPQLKPLYASMAWLILFALKLGEKYINVCLQ